MPRKSPSVAELFADIQPLAEAAPATAAIAARGGVPDRTVRLLASLRGDMAGTPANLLMSPLTYQQRVLSVWTGYNGDPLFKRMLDRAVEFAANGSKWEVPAAGSPISLLDRLKTWMQDEGGKLEREEDIWNEWGRRINTGVPNTLPGINQISTWMAKHLLLSGMFVPHWEWGMMKFGKQELLMPMKMTCYPASAIALARPNSSFSEEEMYYRRPPSAGGATLMDGQVNEAQPNVGRARKAGQAPPGMMALPMMGHDTPTVGETEAFALKYYWSPGDLVTTRAGQMSSTGLGIYPIVPFLTLMPQLAIRAKLFAADLAVLDGIVNYLELWKIGDKDHPPQAPEYKAGKLVKDGTIAQVRKLIQEGRTGQALELFLPYYVTLDIKTPDTAVLLNETKYVQSTIEIFSGFGIFFSRAQGSRERMERINIANFEEFLLALRMVMRDFWQMLADRIVQANRAKLTHAASWSPNPINTKSDKFVDQLFQARKLGNISAQTLLRGLGLDSDVEVRRVISELGNDTDDVFNQNVPVSYVQQTVQPDTGGEHPDGAPAPAKKKETRIPSTKQPGRPRKGPGDGAPPAE